MRLAPLDFDTYAREVLPRSASMWAGHRDLATYIAQTEEIARSGYGRRHFRLLGFFDGDRLVASIKRYERTIHFGEHRLRAIGIGAVFTPEEYRGRGYASAMLATLLDRSRADGIDVAYLFSGIRPQFYTAIGFAELPSRSISLRVDGLVTPRIEVQRLDDGDWPGVRRCFELGERSRPWGMVRTPLVWEWIRLRMRHGSEHPVGVQTDLVVRRGRGIAAYVLGVRAPEHDAFLLDEFGFADADAARLVPSLLRSAAGDLHRVTGWLPPDGAREHLPRAAVRKRSDATFMAAALSRSGERWLKTAATPSSADGVWSSDHI